MDKDPILVLPIATLANVDVTFFADSDLAHDLFDMTSLHENA